MQAERLGKYQLVRHLASGGMANVYLARLSGPGGFERHVVLKTLRTDGVADPALIPMFLDEARVVATLHHQHIAQVYEVGREDETYFLAMEYVHGETVRQVLETAVEHERTLPLAFGVTVVCAAAAGLHHAHERRGTSGALLGIVHRDVTPSNVIVSYDGSVKLIDFGIAKAEGRATHTRTGFIKGKVGYMAPEQVRGYAVDRRSDVFALGVLAYELTTQKRAFGAESQFEALERTVHSDLISPSQVVPGFPPELEDVILTALEHDPDDRYPDADAMRRALERAASSLQLPIGQPAVVSVLDKLYGYRPEPWLLGRGSRDELDDEPTPVREPSPVIEMRALADSRAFARGSGGHDSLDDETPTLPPVPPPECVAVDFEEQVTDRLALLEPADVLPPMWAPPPPIVLPPPPALRPPTPIPVPDLQIRPSARVALVVVAVGVAFAIGLVAFFAMRDPSSEIALAPATAPAASAAPAQASRRSVVPPSASGSPAASESPASSAPNPAAVSTMGQVTLHVVTDPPGATVVLDGVRLGTSPYIGQVTIRTVRSWLKVRRSDRLPVKIPVALDRDVTWNVRLPARP